MTGRRAQTGDRKVTQGGAIAGVEGPAFTLSRHAEPAVPVLIAVPHAGRSYPPQVREAMRDEAGASLRLEDRHVDQLARDVARATGASLLVAHAPRAMLDLNRAKDDIDWGMVEGQRPHPARHSKNNRRARSGLGLVPRRLSGLGEIWHGPLAREDLDARISSIHRPYHKALSGELSRIRDIWGAALLIDFHSMPPLKPRFGEDHAPQYVIGDRFGASCDAALSGLALRYFGRHGELVAHNRPYSGGYVLDTHGAPRRALHALQLEICRATYLDARLDQPIEQAAAVSRLLAGLVRELGEGTARLVDGGAFPQAAE